MWKQTEINKNSQNNLILVALVAKGGGENMVTLDNGPAK